MSKREARNFAAAGVDVDAPRAKRRKDAPATSNTSPDSKQHTEAATANGAANEAAEIAVGDVEDKATVKEKGLQLWQTVKDAVDKDGQIASFQFMRLPSKRQYPDYYALIKHPIALDDIKSKLESREYASLQDVLQDLETCFRNAKRYNMKDSQIFKDAKFLHKLSTKEYNRMAGNGDEGSEDEEKKKASSAYRLLKTRLQKLVDKTDEHGRALSMQFMELPSRKQWPIYYTIIKKPQCIGNVFKKLKQKEYSQPVDFANDVELVFSNALEFNQEHTQIWEDAVALREYFRKLMSDLPEPFTIPAYANSSAHPTKIKLKLPPHAAPPPLPTPITASSPSLPSSNSITVRGHNHASATSQGSSKKDVVPAAVPAPSLRLPHTVKAQSATPAIPPTSAPISTQNFPTTPRGPVLTPTPSIPAIVPQAQKPAHTSTLRTPIPLAPAAPTPFQTLPFYQSPALAPAPPKSSAASPAIPSSSVAASSTAPVPAVTRRPSLTPAQQYAHPLSHAIVTTLPYFRRLILDHTDEVRTWALRLNGHETALVVSDVTFLSQRGDEEDDSSEDDEPRRQEEEEEEEQEEQEAVAPAKKKAPGRPRKRRRTRVSNPKKKRKTVDVNVPTGELQVKLNGVIIPGNGSEGQTWEVQVPPGMSQLEVGEKGGMVWKVYLDRAGF